MIRRLIVPLTAAVATLYAGQSLAQGAFPALLPGQAGAANASPFPPVTEATQFTSPLFGAPRTQAGSNDDCASGFLPLREEAEKRGKLIKAASDRNATPDEACKLIGNFVQAEVKMLKYVEVNAARCGIPPQILDQLKRGHQGTETMQQKVCSVAQQQQRRPILNLSEALGSSPKGPSGPTGDFWLPGEKL
jgi:hypothetical protein